MSTLSLRKRRNPNYFLLAILLVAGFMIHKNSKAQCGFAAGLGCSNTDYNNFGFNSTSNAATLEYDNYVSAYHQTVARTFSGEYQVWGDLMASDGVSPVLSPQAINSTNYPVLTGTVLKATVGANGDAGQQLIVLTTTGLFVSGSPGAVVSTGLSNVPEMTKLNVVGRSNGMPLGVEPTDVKMLFATNRTLALVTCSGEAWVMTQTSAMRGNNSAGNPNAWYRVLTSTNESDRLTGVVAVRGSSTGMIALTGDGKLWTWGSQTYLGDGTARAKRVFAYEMAQPKPGTIKMIGAASDGVNTSYYVLYADGGLYTVGNNSKRQLGDWTANEKNAWVQPKYHSNTGSAMNNIKWISPSEHNADRPAISVINNDMNVFTWGQENRHSLGRGNDTTMAVNPGMPAGLTGVEEIESVETGGHFVILTAKCHDNFGFVGHRANGSMGDGLSGDGDVTSVNFNTAAVSICGAGSATNLGAWVLNSSGTVCSDVRILLDPTPVGGTLTVLSGPGTISENELIFTGTGDVVVQYVTSAACGTKTITRTFNVESCNIYKVNGFVWIDNNQDAIKDAGESGTNTALRLTNGLWANLVDHNGLVVQSAPVNMNGSYELFTAVAGTYSVQITNERIGESTAIHPASKKLSGTWKYTGKNSGTACVVPACSNPDVITNINLSAASPVISAMNFGVIEESLMPVELIGFSAARNGESVRLSWATATETDNIGFEVHRSSDGTNWSVIAFVPTHARGGNSLVELHYNFTDNNPRSGANYYRLKQISEGNRFVYSRTVTAQLGDGRTFTVFPNPTTDIVQVRGLTGKETVILLDNSGRRLRKQNANGSSVQLDLSGYVNGIYRIIVTDGMGTSRTFSILKK